MTKIFLSYSRADESHSERLYESLSARGFEVWFDKESLLPGQVWEEVIRTEIAASDFVILMLSKKSVGKRGFFLKELRLALDVLDTIPFGHIYILPVRIDDCKIPPRLSDIHWVDLFPVWERSLTKLFKAIEWQTEVQSRARVIAEADASKGSEEIRLLLVNDQPATMNFASDLWKSCGITVDYAFDVPQALKTLEHSAYSIVISDLSHFSADGLITDRAAFEILEWARDTGKEIKLIISTCDVTPERIQLAHDLGAVGICNNLEELNALLTEATGHKIDYPHEFAAINVLQPNSVADSALREQASRNRFIAFISCSQADREFVQQLARDLEYFGIYCWFDLPSIAVGQTWSSPITRMIRQADVMLAIVSARSVESTWFQREVYEGITNERGANGFIVIPLVLDDDAVKKMPYFLRTRMYADFRDDYKAALMQLVDSLNRIVNSR